MTANLFLLAKAAAAGAPAEEKIRPEAFLIERIRVGDAEAFGESLKPKNLHSN